MSFTIVGGASGIVVLFMLALKAVEVQWGLPQFMKALRDKVDDFLWELYEVSKEKLIATASELRIAFSRVPHMFIHLAIIYRDRFRNRFAHYIDEVKGRKSIKQKTSNSTYLHAVKAHKEEKGGGQIE